MRTFTCFVMDERYEVPTLSFILASDEVRARELARQELLASRQHLGVELLEGERCVFSERRSTI